jgi:hypothetical protein
MDRNKLTTSQKAGRSIKRTPWKVDVRDRLDQVREDIEMAVLASGWKITIAPDWPSADDEPREKGGPGAAIALETPDGSAASPQMREAEAVVSTTFRYMAKTEATIRLSTQRWQRPWEWLTGGLLMSAYTSLHAAEANRILLLGSDQLAALLPTIRQRAVKYLPAGDPRLAALQGLPDPTEPTHQALARVQSQLVQVVTAAHTAAQAQEKASLSVPKSTQGSGEAATPAGGRQEPQGTGPQPTPEVAPATEKPESDTQASRTDLTSSEASPYAPAPPRPAQAPPDAGPDGPGGGNGANGGPPDGSTGPDRNLVTLTGMLGLDQRIAAMAMGEATRAEDQQQTQVRRFRGVLLGTFLGLLIAVVLLAILGSAHPSYFPLCLQKQATTGATTVCPTGGNNPSRADLAFIMAIGGIGAVLAVATNLTSLKPIGVRYSLSVVQGLVKVPFGAITAMLGIIILSTQSNIGVLATHAGLISTAVVFGYSQQIFTKLIDKRADDLVNQAGGT